MKSCAAARHIDRPVLVRRWLAAGTAWLFAALVGALCALPPPAAGQSELPVSATVRVLPPAGVTGPRPTGRLIVAVEGVVVLSVPLTRGQVPLIDLIAALPTGHVTVRYSGDDYYDPAGGISITLPTRRIVTIIAKPRDRRAPTVALSSPAAGARFARGETARADFRCDDPDDRNPVTRCEGTIPNGAPLDTSVAGSFTFEVHTRDAMGNAAVARHVYEVVDAGSSGSSIGAPGPAGTSTPSATSHGTAPSAPDVTPQTAVAPPAADVPATEPGVAALEADLQRPPASPRTAERQPAGAERQPAGAQPPAAGAPKPSASAAASAPALAPYDPASDPEKVVATLAAAVTLLTLIGGGLASGRPHGRSSGGSSRQAEESDYAHEGIDFEQVAVGFAAIARGDRSRTWMLPGTRAVDAVSAEIPIRLARRSPLLARITEDGAYLRAVLGSAALLPLAAAIALGVLAVDDVGGDALPPSTTLLVAIAVLGVFDATAGLLAVAVFGAGVLLLGGVGSESDARTLLALAVVWCAVPLLAGAARPLRRPPASSAAEAWDRAADFVIGALIGAWVVYETVGALSGIAGLRLPVADDAATAALAVLVALVVRLAIETLAAHLYPRRLSVVEPAELPDPGLLPRAGAVVLRTALFVFFANIIAGDGWQLWVGAALFALPQVLALFEDRLPNSPRLFAVLPRGLLELVLMLAVVTAIGALLLGSDEPLANSFVILLIPGAVLSVLALLGRDGRERPLGWAARLAGIPLLALGVGLATGVV